MIRDTFETNPGLCELFKRKMVERARFVGISKDAIDFGSQIDMKGTYQDNLRALYRAYPQLLQESDYVRIKSIRPLSGAALEQTWRAYRRNNGREIPEPTRESTEQPTTAEVILPELTITYTVGAGTVMAAEEDSKEPELISPQPTIQQADVVANSAASTHSELLKSILNHLTAMAGEKVTKLILHEIGREIVGTAYNHSRDHTLFHSPIEALDHVLSTRGLGRVLSLDKADHGLSVTYVCTIKGCPLCHEGASPSPTCDIMRGVVSRWLESFVQKNAEGIETVCAAGSKPCVIRVTFRK